MPGAALLGPYAIARFRNPALAEQFYDPETTYIADFDGDGDLDIWDYAGDDHDLNTNPSVNGPGIYLQNQGGMTSMDGEFWRLWSLDEIVRENQGPPSEWGVQFADYLSHSHVFRLRTAAGGRSEVFAGPLSGTAQPVRVTASLAEFFALYRHHPEQVLPQTG